MRKHLHKTLASLRDSLPTLNLQTYQEIPGSKGTVFRITASHGQINRPLTASEYVDMCHAAYGEKLSLLPGTIQPIEDNGRLSVISGLLRSNTVSRPAGNLEGYKSVSANVFMDDDSGIWKLVGEGEGRRLVQAVSEDLSKILEARVSRSANTVVAGLSNYVGIVPERGDYALYFSLASMGYEYGYAVPCDDNSIMIAPRKRDGVESISAAQIIDCAERASLEENKQDRSVVASLLGNGGNKITTQNMSADMSRVYLDYMRNIYADTPYFDALENLISLRRGLADLNRPISTMVS